MASPARLAGVGAFVAAGVILFAIALFMIGDRQMAFARKYIVYTEFAKITGLQPGAIVRVSGAKAGTVREIEPPPDPSRKFRVRLEITSDLRQLVRTDSIATIETEGLVGGSFLSVSTGTPAAAEAPAGSTIASREPFLVSDIVEEMRKTLTMVNATITSLSTQLQEVLGSVQTTVVGANALIADVGADVKTLASAGARISDDAAQIARRIRNGEGTLGKLVTDDELYQRVTTVAKNAEAIAAETRDAVQQAKRALEGLQTNDGNVAALTTSLRDTVEQARGAMAGLAENMDALKRNFLVRGFFNRRGYFELDDISPDEYRRSTLTANAKKKVLRVWLGEPVLFQADQKTGAEVLTADGRSRLTSAMTPYLSSLADGVLMIEGYAQAGARAEQYLASRRRAAAVRDYLIVTFGLEPGSVGVMPLGADSQGSPEGKAWDGVALAFFTDKH
jgi:phospholipid/cholesterol/gamma-HCH transport system substrate-binding protein